ncbi:MAG: phosphonate transport system ATP-binding protein [Verrucomicrobiales bacterium]|jgi:phosphonate transport system ATP-binding protein
MNEAAAAARPHAFQLRDVTVRFADLVALDQVNLTIAEGERVGFVGPSGAGKTTLLRLLNASQHADQGSLTILGRQLDQLDGRSLRTLRSEIGLIPQRFHLVPSLRVLQNVLMGQLGQQGFWASARSLLFPNQTEQLAVHTLLERVGIAEKLFAKTDTLSGGQQQRVAIARALYQSPKALLADEPVASVDPSRARATMELLVNLADESQLTLGISLHDQELARAFLPRLVGIREGGIFKDAPTEEWTDNDFKQLYHLSNTQHLEDGHGD